MRTTLAALVCGSFLLAGCGSSGPGTASASNSEQAPKTAVQTMTVSGGVSLPGGCGSQRNDSYPDISKGAQVTVYNSDTKPIALGTLGRGLNAEGGLGPCTYPFAIPDVPSDGSIYSIVIGARSPYQFSKQDSESLFLNLGK